MGSGHTTRPQTPLFSEAQYQQSDFPFDGSTNRYRGVGLQSTHDSPRLVPGSCTTIRRTTSWWTNNQRCSRRNLPLRPYAVYSRMVERDAFAIFWLSRLSPPIRTVFRKGFGIRSRGDRA